MRRPYLESIVATAVVVLVGFVTNREDPAFVTVKLHPFLFITIFIAAWYGAIPGRFAGTVSGVAYIVGSYVYEKVYSFRLIFEFNTYFLPVVFLFTGATLGEVRERFKRREQETERRAANLAEKYRIADDHIKVLKYTNAELETAVAGNFSTFSVLYEAARKLDTLERPDLYAAAEHIFVEQLHFTHFAMYLKSGDRFDRVGGRWTVHEPPAVLTDLHPLTRACIHQRGVVSVRDRANATTPPEGRVLLACPFSGDDGALIGFVEVYDMPFLKFNPNTFKMLEMTVNWIAKTLEQIRELEWHKSKNIIDENLDVYTYPYFRKRVAEEFSRSRQYSMPLSAALIAIEDFAQIDFAGKTQMLRTLNMILKKNLTAIDILARYREENRIAILFIAKGDEEAAERIGAIRDEIGRFDFHPYRDRERPLAFRAAAASFEMADTSEDQMIRRMEEALAR